MSTSAEVWPARDRALDMLRSLVHTFTRVDVVETVAYVLLSLASALAGSLAAHGVNDWSTAGENVGYGSSVEEVHQRFMASSAHRANILNPSFRQAGVGVVAVNGTTWVTIVFLG